MTLTVNGKTMQCNDAVTVADLLAETGYKEVYVAVELNEEIVPRENFKTCVLKENDVVEIVTSVSYTHLFLLMDYIKL